MAQRFLILHGLFGSSLDHWQVWLARRLRSRGDWIGFPELPESDRPTLGAWQDALAEALAELAAGAGERVILCHSLGALLWLWHTPAVTDRVRPDRVLLVAPPCSAVLHPEIAGFLPVAADAAQVAAAAGQTRLVCSDNDPYCPPGAALVYGEGFGIETEVIPGAGHLNADAGYGPWPHLEAWCLGLRPGVAW